MSSSAVPIAPDLDKTIEAAQAELARAVQICSLRNDPLRHPLEALSATLGAMHRIFADGSRAVADQIANAPHPVSKAELDEACERIAATVAAHSRQAMKAGGRDIANWAVTRLDRSTTIFGPSSSVLLSLAGCLTASSSNPRRAGLPCISAR